MKFWAVLGRRGCREKNLPTAISMQLLGEVFSTFCGQKKSLKFLFAHKKLIKIPQKVAYLWQLGGFFLCSPDCPKPHIRFMNYFLTLKTLKIHPKKLHTYGSWEVFFSAAPTAQNSPELHIRFIDSPIQSSVLKSVHTSESLCI